MSQTAIPPPISAAKINTPTRRLDELSLDTGAGVDVGEAEIYVGDAGKNIVGVSKIGAGVIVMVGVIIAGAG